MRRIPQCSTADGINLSNFLTVTHIFLTWITQPLWSESKPYFGLVHRRFFSRRPQRTSKHTSKSNPPSKNYPKNWLLLWLVGALRVLGGALTHFPCKLRLKKKTFFTALVGAGHPLHPLATPMVWFFSVEFRPTLYFHKFVKKNRPNLVYQ